MGIIAGESTNGEAPDEAVCRSQMKSRELFSTPASLNMQGAIRQSALEDLPVHHKLL